LLSKCLSIARDQPFNIITGHDPCYLTKLETNKAGVDGIAGCAAFNGSQTCNRCGHTPKEHLHVKFLYHEKTEISQDPEVQAKMKSNASEVQIKQAALEALKRQISEFEQEKAMIEDAQAKFSWYLEENSITVYNNVTLEYLDHQIRAEKAKMAYGDPRRAAIIQALEASKKKHEVFVNAMRHGKRSKHASRHQPLDAKGVERLIDALCAMRHFGQQFADARDAVQNAYLKQFRERPFRVRRQEPYMARRETVKHGKQQQVRSMIPDDMAGHSAGKQSMRWDINGSTSRDAGAEITPAEASPPLQAGQDEVHRKKSSYTAAEQTYEDGPPPYSPLQHATQLPPNPKRASLGNLVRKTSMWLKVKKWSRPPK